MTATEINETTFGSSQCDFENVVPIYNPRVYRCHIAFIKEADGSYSAIVLNLPGAGSCGATHEDAMTNVKEAAAGVIASFVDEGKDIPWLPPTAYAIPEDAIQKWIVVNV